MEDGPVRLRVAVICKQIPPLTEDVPLAYYYRHYILLNIFTGIGVSQNNFQLLHFSLYLKNSMHPVLMLGLQHALRQAVGIPYVTKTLEVNTRKRKLKL